MTTSYPPETEALQQRIRELEATLSVFKQQQRYQEEQRLAEEDAEREAAQLFLKQQYAEIQINAQTKALVDRVSDLESALVAFKEEERAREEARLAAEEAELQNGRLFLMQKYAQELKDYTTRLETQIQALETQVHALEAQVSVLVTDEAAMVTERVQQAAAIERPVAPVPPPPEPFVPAAVLRGIYHQLVPLEKRLEFRAWRRRMMGRDPGPVPWIPPKQPGRSARTPAQIPAPPVTADKRLTVHVPETIAQGGRPDIFIFSIIEFSARYQRPQQLAVHFARAGHRVFYVSSAQFLGPTAPRYQVKPLAENVFEVQINLGGAQPAIYESLMSETHVGMALGSLDALRRDMQVHSAIGLVHLPYWTPLSLALRTSFGWRLVYDCMDEWEGFPLIASAILQGEKTLIAESDLVTVTGSVLYDKWSPQARRCLLVRNGVDFEFFAERTTFNPLLDDMQHPIVGYYSALAEWLDYELLGYLAEQRPEVQFVLLGDIFTDISRLDGLPNVHLLGRKPYEQMPQYLFHFDVCLIPFRIYSVTHAVDPVKFYEYLSAGKPVVSAHLHELDVYSEYLYLADSHEEFLAKLDIALAERSIELRQKRIALARQNRWMGRVESLQGAIRALYPKVSIIIVTYNNVALTRACVESVLAHTAWPNIEIILVDNASTDSTPAYLSMLEMAHPQIKVILNATNAGFAAANNQGLEAAMGERLILLNNDTVVPPGWLEGLMRHLDDSAVGMVGPVTNFVGNEARVPVTYRDVAQMPAFARQLMHSHAGQTFEISMLAMFCVAFRRDVYQRIGGLDETFGIGMFEDDDYSERVRQAGLKILCARDVFVHHVGQAAFGKLIRDGSYDALWAKNQAYYEQKWGKQWTQNKPE